jgi:hypothetical protein
LALKKIPPMPVTRFMKPPGRLVVGVFCGVTTQGSGA